MQATGMIVQPLTIGQMVSTQARLQPDKIAARDLNRAMTYRELNSRANRLANALLGLGMETGQRLAVLAYNRVEWVEIYIAVAKAGLVAVPINFRLTAAEAAFIVSHSDAAAVIVESVLVNVVDSIRADTDIAASHFIVINSPDKKTPGYQDYESLLLAASDAVAPTPVVADDPWCIMYTSGTTGRPKGAVRSHRGMSMLALMTAVELKLHRQDDALLVMPMCHANSLNFFATFINNGGTVTIFSRESFDPALCLRTFAETGATFTSLVPTHYSMLLDAQRESIAGGDYGRVEKLMISSAPARPDTKQAVMEMFPNSGFYELYGSTEAGWVTMLHSHEQFDRLGPAYLDTGESKGLIADSHASVVAAMRGAVMSQADVVLTIGRRLDFQLAYGSPSVFGDARFIRIADTPGELRDNRRGEVEVYAEPAAALAAIVKTAGNRIAAVDEQWVNGLRHKHLERADKLKSVMANSKSDQEGRIHPNRSLHELQQQMKTDAVLIADGGDFLSFARIGLSASTYLDPGSLGCIGIGTPFGIAASLALPGRQVIVATGDGAFGFNAMEIDTAVRHQAPVLIVVANNGAWQIEVNDQLDNHGKVVGTQLQSADHAAMARAFGLHAERVERAEDLSSAINRALANTPALLDVVVTPDVRSSDGKTGLAWVPDLQALEAWDDAERRWRDQQ